jgi:hypothetical protein
MGARRKKRRERKDFNTEVTEEPQSSQRRTDRAQAGNRRGGSAIKRRDYK